MANSSSIKVAMQTMCTMLSLGACNFGHVQYPIPHSNTSSEALIKHKRIIEDLFNAAGFSITTTLALHVTRPNDARQSDQRECIHTCLCLSTDFKASLWTAPVFVGPVPLIKVADMIGYDPDNRPSATFRVEQTL